jgi:hypothetical protein
MDDIDNLVSEATEADVRLHNTFNEFLMLANNQFIENVILAYYYSIYYY